MTFLQNLWTRRNEKKLVFCAGINIMINVKQKPSTILKSGLSNVRNSTVPLQMMVAALFMSWRSASSPKESPANISPTIWKTTSIKWCSVGKYWPEVVVAVRTSLRSVRTKATEGQYFPVCLEQAWLVSLQIHGYFDNVMKKFMINNGQTHEILTAICLTINPLSRTKVVRWTSTLNGLYAPKG